MDEVKFIAIQQFPLNRRSKGSGLNIQQDGGGTFEK